MKTLFLFIMLIATACSTAPKGGDNILPIIEKLEFSQPREKIIQLLGKPIRIHIVDGQEFWIYTDSNGLQNISLGFKGTSEGPLQSKTLYITEHDLVANLDVAMEHFRTISFNKTLAPWGNSHAGPSVVFYENQMSGIRLIVSKRHKLVTAIDWWNPNNPPQPKKSNITY